MKEKKPCSKCGGRGVVWVRKTGTVKEPVNCDKCKGRGTV